MPWYLHSRKLFTAHPPAPTGYPLHLFLSEALSGFPQCIWWLPLMDLCLNQPQVLQSWLSYSSHANWLSACPSGAFTPVGPAVLICNSCLISTHPSENKGYIYFFFQRSPLDFSILDQALPPTIPTPNVVG